MNLEIEYMQGYGFLSFANSMSTHATKVAKNKKNKYSQKLIYSANKSTADAIETASKRTIQKTAEATGDLIVNKTANLSIKAWQNDEPNNENEIPRERYISPEKRNKKFLMN